MKNLGVILVVSLLAQGAIAQQQSAKVEAAKLRLAFNEQMLTQQQTLLPIVVSEVNVEVDLSEVNAKLEQRLEQQLQDKLESQLDHLTEE